MGDKAVKVGQRAPDFTLTSTDGTTVQLADCRGKKVVLYFYPKDDTPGCTKEACSFQEHRKQVADFNAVVLGVSRDSVSSHQRFAGKYGLSFPLLSDPDATVCRAYGAYKQKSMYGRTYWGIERTTVIIDEEGRIANIFPKVKVEGHTQEVLEAIKAIGIGSEAGARRPARTPG